jgi:F-type H+-transporting ATPase subunit epsilon
MAQAFTAEVLTPEGEVFKDEVTQVSTRTTTGSISFLAGHQPLLGLLEPAELHLYREGGERLVLAQGEGYVQVSGNGVLLLVEEAIAPGDLDTADLQEKLRKAEDAFAAADAGSEAAKVAARDKRRWETFLRIAGGPAA